MDDKILQKDDIRQYVNDILDLYPDGIALEIEMSRGVDEVIEPSGHFREFRPGKGITMKIKFAGGAMNGFDG